LTKQADPLERAKGYAAGMYPEATITTRNHQGRPIVLAVEGDLVRIVKLAELAPGEKLASKSP
jgi:hypothetical protein